MGRFTLRDEGKTIALGKVLKYKPVKVSVLATSTQVATNSSQQEGAKEEIKQEEQIT
jgi:hypothetical protein